MSFILYAINRNLRDILLIAIEKPIISSSNEKKRIYDSRESVYRYNKCEMLIALTMVTICNLGEHAVTDNFFLFLC